MNIEFGPIGGEVGRMLAEGEHNDFEVGRLIANVGSHKARRIRNEWYEFMYTECVMDDDTIDRVFGKVWDAPPSETAKYRGRN